MRWTPVLILVALVALQGCAAAAATLLGAGAGVTAGAATEYSINGTAYRTFTASLGPVYQATRAALNEMGMLLKTDERTPDGRALTASAGERKVEIELVALTPRATQMRVTVKDGVFFRDRATAGELIIQADTALDRSTTATQKTAEPKNGDQKATEPKNGDLRKTSSWILWP